MNIYVIIRARIISKLNYEYKFMNIDEFKWTYYILCCQKPSISHLIFVEEYIFIDSMKHWKLYVYYFRNYLNNGEIIICMNLEPIEIGKTVHKIICTIWENKYIEYINGKILVFKYSDNLEKFTLLKNYLINSSIKNKLEACALMEKL